MTNQFGPMIACSGDLGLSYAERLLTGVTPEQFGRFAQVGQTVVESNHPAFIYGHLSLYARNVVEMTGGDPSGIEPSETFQAAFSKDAKCVDDPRGEIYPPMQEITATLFEGYRAALQALREVDDAVLTEPNRNVAMRGKFPTTGALLAFYVGGHFMMHMGQMSAWRRAMGLGAA